MGKDNYFDSDREFDKELKKSLRSFGFLFPTTDSEVEAFENEYDVNSIDIPESIQDPIEILKKGRLEKISKEEVSIVALNTVTNLKKAARKGKSIPQDIIDKMKKDRDDAENENKE